MVPGLGAQFHHENLWMELTEGGWFALELRNCKLDDNFNALTRGDGIFEFASTEDDEGWRWWWR